jgi:hypothetical protein
MNSTNQKLMAKAESSAATMAEESVSSEESVHVLVDRWASLNVVRSILLLSSAALGAWASLSPTEVLGIDRVEILSGANRLG